MQNPAGHPLAQLALEQRLEPAVPRHLQSSVHETRQESLDYVALPLELLCGVRPHAERRPDGLVQHPHHYLLCGPAELLLLLRMGCPLREGQDEGPLQKPGDYLPRFHPQRAGGPRKLLPGSKGLPQPHPEQPRRHLLRNPCHFDGVRHVDVPRRERRRFAVQHNFGQCAFEQREFPRAGAGKAFPGCKRRGLNSGQDPANALLADTDACCLSPSGPELVSPPPERFGQQLVSHPPPHAEQDCVPLPLVSRVLAPMGEEHVRTVHLHVRDRPQAHVPPADNLSRGIPPVSQAAVQRVSVLQAQEAPLGLVPQQLVRPHVALPGQEDHVEPGVDYRGLSQESVVAAVPFVTGPLRSRRRSRAPLGEPGTPRPGAAAAVGRAVRGRAAGPALEGREDVPTRRAEVARLAVLSVRAHRRPQLNRRPEPRAGAQTKPKHGQAGRGRGT